MVLIMNRMSIHLVVRWWAFLVIGLTIISSIGYAGANATDHRRPAFVPGELLVKYKPSVSVADRVHHRNLRGMNKVQSFKNIDVERIKLPDHMSVGEALELYKDDPDIEYAEPNYYLYAYGVPNDMDFDNLWGLNNTGQYVDSVSGTFDADMDATEAWDITTGSSSVIVAVVDSGADFNHPDLTANIWINPGETPGDGIDNDNNGYPDDVRGWDFITKDNDPNDKGDNNPMDPDGHGTHVAGTIGAVGDNGIGIAGVTWNAKLMILKFLDATGTGTTAGAIAAINYATDKGAHVINCSWGGPDNSFLLQLAIEASSALVVCAAGNASSNNDLAPEYPTSYPSSNIISVAATNQDDGLAWFSNIGATSVDVGAPGTNIYSTVPARQTLAGFPDDFDDNNMNGWTTGGTNNTWAPTNTWGPDDTPQASSSNFSLADSPGSGVEYQNNTDAWARAPMLNLTSHAGTVLRFQLRGATQTDVDYLSVEVSTDLVNWIPMLISVEEILDFRISGTSLNADWYEATVDLGIHDGQPSVYFRFRLITNSAITNDGWYIDNVTVTSSTTGEEYVFFQGTSMAAPHVSGLAALIKALNPSFTHTQIKAVIENSGDALASLSGKTVTGRRINAAIALDPNPPAAPSNLFATSNAANAINLTWIDNADNEAGFEIERKRSDGGTYAQIVSTASGATFYQDTGLIQGTAYTYRVRAFNGSGDSDYSNEGSATTITVVQPSSSSSSGGGCFILTVK